MLGLKINAQAEPHTEPPQGKAKVKLSKVSVQRSAVEPKQG